MNYQTYTFEKEWKEIETMESKGLPKSAQTILDQIYVLAKNGGNEVQLLKIFLKRVQILAQVEEGSIDTAYRLFGEEIARASNTNACILKSLLGKTLHSYLQNNIWQIQNRTPLQDQNLTQEIQTWDISRFSKEIQTFYFASVNELKDKTIPTKQYQDLLNNPSDKYLLTVYDLLLYGACEYFKQPNSHLTEPVYKFVLNRETYFAPVKDFAALSIQSPDSSSSIYQALRLFQVGLQHHLQTGNEAALLDLDLRRLEFVYQNSTISNKKEFYLAALDKIIATYPKNSEIIRAIYLVAYESYKDGMQYASKKDTLSKNGFKRALAIIENGIKQFPDKNTEEIQNLIKAIRTETLSFQVEEVNLPNRAILCRADVKSITNLCTRVFKISNSAYLKYFQSYNYEDNNIQFREIVQQKPLASASFQLNSFDDFQTHSTELKLDALPIGTYLVGLSSSVDFNSGMKEYKVLHVSNIAWMHRNDEQKRREFMMLHRETGKPLTNVIAETYQVRYNNRRSDLTKIATDKTDKRGYLYTKIGPDQGGYFVRFIQDKDTLLLNNNYYNYGRSEPNLGHKSVIFLTDRSIYRPGQTVFFKGIAVNHVNNMPNIAVGASLRIQLNDVNGQQVGNLAVVTNDYGSFNGSFVVPEGGLTGQYAITCENGYQTVQVEAYKRPTFEVKMDPIEGSYQLGAKISAKGRAIGYSGNAINDAQIKYRITRKKDYPYWPWWFSRWMPSGNDGQVEIENGIMETAQDGSFEVSFVAKNDDVVDVDNPRFLFEINVDVVDQTGETRSTSATVFVCEIPFLLQASIPEQTNRKKATAFVLQTTNHNGQKVATSLKVKISKLLAPKNTQIQRYWELPDYQMLSKSQFEQFFPLYSYAGEDLVHNWKVDKLVLEEAIAVRPSDSILYDMEDWLPGQYVIEIEAIGDNGAKVTTKKFFTLYDLQSEQLPASKSLATLIETSTLEPGDTCKVHLSSKVKSLNVLTEVERQGKILNSSWKNVDDFEQLDYPIQEIDRGNFHIRFVYLLNNRYFNETRTIEVPWSNKDLQISYETFRDKLLPGQEEQWKLKITGHKKDRVMAEMLATMYDASLDQFLGHSFNKPALFPYSYVQKVFEFNCFGLASEVQSLQDIRTYYGVNERLTLAYPDFQYYFDGGYMNYGGQPRMASAMMMRSEAPGKMEDKKMKDGIVDTMDPEAVPSGNASPTLSKPTSAAPPMQIRTNLKETVFFFPNLETDAEGSVIVKFKMNDALTKWKFMAFAHDKNLATAVSTKEILTQKDLMVLPNAPRFFREGDTIVFTGKVINLAKKDLYGSAKLEFSDAVTGADLNAVLSNSQIERKFSIGAGLSQKVEWRLVIPNTILNTLRFRISATSGDFSDAEENVIPVVSNRMLVTETLPLPVGPNQTKNFALRSMVENNSSTKTNHRFTLEFTPNPVWYAVKALPYLMEFPHECAEQVFNRFYSNSLAEQIANSTPKIRAVFEAWKNDPNALKSNLETNPELKSALLEETPWVLAAQSEATQRKNIGLLFDLNKMAYEKQSALKKLAERVNADGGFSWFPGGPSSDYITQYLVEGMGHLQKLGVRVNEVSWLSNSINYIDLALIERYDALKKQAAKKLTKMEDDHLDYLSMHYLYARSFFDQPANDQRLAEAKNYYLGQAKKYWRKGLYNEGLVALSLFRNKETVAAVEIVKSLKERSLNSEELGMYWKNPYGYHWYELPIETHALMIEVFAEITKDEESVEKLKTWLLKNKQTNNWSTTKGTAGAIYALLMNGNKWLESEQMPVIKLGSQLVDLKNVKKEAGSDYFKIEYAGNEIKPEMANIKIENKNAVPSWGAIYWQYFEQLDKIRSFKETPLTLVKQYYLEENTPTGPKLVEITAKNVLRPGDKLKVRIVLRVDREMEYIHLKDMRPSNTEPMNIISQYKWQDGLGYYESTKDLASHFFISNLPKGTYVFEYPVRVIHEGNCSTGIASIQSMYAPEFSSHSNGLMLKVGK